jgi:hypothetical protein
MRNIRHDGAKLKWTERVKKMYELGRYYMVLQLYAVRV